MLDVERWRFASYIRECTVVTFTRIPYAEARRARRQDRIVYASLIAAALSVLLSPISLFRLILH
jgi:hypothetical protein